MEIFNIHLFEFLLVAGLALIVFGPERLPEVGRFLGQQVARFLAWQQQSPELRMINDVRAEFEQEIASLRDELVRTRKDLDITQDVNALRDELRPMLNLRDPQPAAPQPAATSNGAVSAPNVLPAGDPTTALVPEAPPPEAPPLVEAAGEVAEELVKPVLEPSAPLTPQPATGTVPAAVRPNRLAATTPTTVLTQGDERADYLAQRRRSLHDPPTYDEPAGETGTGRDDVAAALSSTTDQPVVTASEQETLRQLQALRADLQALVSELRERGMLGPTWQPPSDPHEQETMSR